MDKEKVELENKVYIDFIIYTTRTMQKNIHGSNNDSISIIGCFENWIATW